MVRRLLLLNGICIIGVLLFHAAGWGFVAMFSWTHRYMPVTSPNYDQIGSLMYYIMRLIEQLVVFVIPAFLFVSGFFAAFATGRNQSTIGWGTVKARIIKIIIPYLIWTFILIGGLLLEGVTISPRGYLGQILLGKINPAYYYVPLLIQFYLLSPLIIYLAKKNWVLLLIVTGIIQVIVLSLNHLAILGVENPISQTLSVSVPKWLFISRLFWFTLGIVACLQLKSFKIWLERYKWYFLMITIVLIPLGVIEWEMYLKWSGQLWTSHRETILDGVYSLSFIFAFLAFDKIVSIPFARQLDSLGSKSFGIYLIHSPVMGYTARVLYHLTPWLLGYQGILLLVLIVVGFGIPLLMMYVVNKTPARRYYQYIFG